MPGVHVISGLKQNVLLSPRHPSLGQRLHRMSKQYVPYLKVEASYGESNTVTVIVWGGTSERPLFEFVDHNPEQ